MTRLAKYEDNLVFVELDLNDESDQRALHCVCKSDFDFHFYDQEYLDELLSCLNRIRNTPKEKINKFEFNCKQFSCIHLKNSTFNFDFVQCSVSIKMTKDMANSLLKGITSVMENTKLDSS